MTATIRRMTRLLISILLLLTLFCQPLLGVGFAEEETAAADSGDTTVEESGKKPIKYVATSRVGLKVRRGAGTNFPSADSIRALDTIYILALGADWAEVRTGYVDGYVLSKHLDDIREYNEATGEIGAVVEEKAAVVDYSTGSTEDFKLEFKALTVKTAVFYQEPDEKSKYVTKIKIYESVVVGEIDGDWCYAMYQNQKGWVKTASLFMWDRINPYAGDIPGCIPYPKLVFLNRTVELLDYDAVVAGKKKPKVHHTLVPGSAIAVENPDEAGRYKTPYWRTTGFVTDEDIAYTMDVVPYDKAEVGDLISAMTTYYAVGVHTLNYQGRNWNIYLSTSKISGSVIQPNETFNIYKYIGPYRKSTGYHPAPIASPTALWGYGGGTCQVSTTLYNTIIRAPLFVQHRQAHANVGIKYMLKGFDAAVGGGDVNLIFVNTLPYPIRINFLISDGVLTCCIFRAG